MPTWKTTTLMTPESQIVEWKSSWRDEYLKWICGFANAQGGVLEIGRNDCGEVVGVSDVLRLLEEIPNKVQSLLGIVVDVDLKSEDRARVPADRRQAPPQPDQLQGQIPLSFREHEPDPAGYLAHALPAGATRADMGRWGDAWGAHAGSGRAHAG